MVASDKKRKGRIEKYIFVVGGVMSGVGKGVTAASLGAILQSKGFRVSAIKIDPYLNIDAGTMNPTEHGEVFVLDSGLECDQDMGNYERFLGKSLPPENYMTTGMVYRAVLEKERRLGYKGKCVEAVPHIPEEIIRRIHASVKRTKAEITIVEIGGTVGEYQNVLFLEAARIMKIRNPSDVLFVMVSYLPIPDKVGEMKTKPTQYAIRTLNSYGIQPDVIIGRSSNPLDRKRKEKIAASSNVPPHNIISAPDIESIYEVPLNFEKDGLSRIVLSGLGLRPRQKDLSAWRGVVRKIKNSSAERVKIGIIGKYFKTGEFILSDVYISIIEALKHAAAHVDKKVELLWLDAEDFEHGSRRFSVFEDIDGVIVPGGFGQRGTEGKIRAIRYVRENKIPFLGICYGMQLAVVEYARNVLGLRRAHTTEVDAKTPHPVIDVMPIQEKNLTSGRYGGTMRLGAYSARLKIGTIVEEAYGASLISERHRHRYEVNFNYVARLEDEGLVFSGRSPNGRLMEVMELPRDVHPFFVATQFHPEFKSSPLNPHPLFLSFVGAVRKG